MNSKKKLFRSLGIAFFSAGILVGIITFVLMNWAYFEAYFFFGYTAPADNVLRSLRCPLMMTTSDVGKVTMSITNTSDRDLEPLIRTEFSYYGAARAERLAYPLKAGETRQLSWDVTSNDMVFGHLIMARVFVFPIYSLPSLSNTCGTVVVDLPWMTGMQLFVVILTFILVCLAAGWILWLIGSRPLQGEGLIGTRAMVLFTAFVLLGLVGGVFGLWGLGLVCTVGCFLMILVIFGYYFQKANR